MFRDGDRVVVTPAATPVADYAVAGMDVYLASQYNHTSDVLTVRSIGPLPAGSYTVLYWSSVDRFHESRLLLPDGSLGPITTDPTLGWRQRGEFDVLCEQRCGLSVLPDGVTATRCSVEC